MLRITDVSCGTPGAHTGSAGSSPAMTLGLRQLRRPRRTPHRGLAVL